MHCAVEATTGLQEAAGYDPPMTPAPEPTSGRCAVIYNPIKVSDSFTDLVTRTLDQHGWRDTLWLKTAEDDPGRSMTAEAVQAGVSLVIGAGGDGTVRIIADGLAGTGIPLGLIPAGTGNLLARNLRLPTTEAAALDVALGGHTQTIDLISITADDGDAEHFAVMAGAGVDAMIMDEVDPQLKSAVGPAAYFVAAGKALGRLPMKISFQVDDHRPRHRSAMLILIGNVGQLRGGISLLPDARADDGLLDVFVASPRRPLHWLRAALGILTRRRLRGDSVDTYRGKRVTIRIKEPDNYQLDGDVAGPCSTLRAEVRPGALTICIPE
jgi:diacylglycerol kinase (ATP)